ncbi:MAG: hypothetical protein IKJ32_06095 [Clostridia bacterium]|nr:hypothetical protein [Clostridia bacterium]
MKKYSNILKNKNEQSVCTYLGFLQNNISRMATNSSNTKALVAVIYTIYATVLSAIEIFEPYWCIGIVITFIGALMDAYYLALERVYVQKYNVFVNDLNKGKLKTIEIYNMKPKNTDFKYEIVGLMLESITSFSIVGYYILFIVITILLKFI